MVCGLTESEDLDETVDSVFTDLRDDQSRKVERRMRQAHTVVRHERHARVRELRSEHDDLAIRLEELGNGCTERLAI